MPRGGQRLGVFASSGGETKRFFKRFLQKSLAALHQQLASPLRRF
jgi:hypothetical protein